MTRTGAVRQALAEPDRAHPGPVLLYDGTCGFCCASARFVRTHDADGRIRVARLEGEAARTILDRHPHLRKIDSLVLVERNGGGERVRVRSDAVLAIAGHMGGLWRFAGVLRLVPRFVRDAAYNAFAYARGGAVPSPGGSGRKGRTGFS